MWHVLGSRARGIPQEEKESMTACKDGNSLSVKTTTGTTWMTGQITDDHVNQVHPSHLKILSFYNSDHQMQHIYDENRPWNYTVSVDGFFVKSQHWDESLDCTPEDLFVSDSMIVADKLDPTFAVSLQSPSAPWRKEDIFMAKTSKAFYLANNDNPAAWIVAYKVETV